MQISRHTPVHINRTQKDIKRIKEKLHQATKSNTSYRTKCKNKIKVINTYTIPLFTYTIQSLTELDQMNMLTRKVCYEHKIHHIQALC